MSGKKVVEAQGSDVQAAVQAGLAQLRLSRDEVEIEVLDEGSKGLLGIGARAAVVRLTAVTIPEPDPDPEPETTEPEIVETAVTPEPTPPPAEPEPEPEPVVAPPAEPMDEESAAALEAERDTAVDIISSLLEKMHVEASLTTALSEPDDLTGRRINIIEIHGDDLSTLIGPRGETLNSLQYIARLMTGHKMRGRAGFVIDVEGYRQRREQALSRLAERMARKVAKRKRAMSLEPMPPHERRIIHMALRDDTYVYTESTGEGNRRKVRIIPKGS